MRGGCLFLFCFVLLWPQLFLFIGRLRRGASASERPHPAVPVGSGLPLLFRREPGLLLLLLLLRALLDTSSPAG